MGLQTERYPGSQTPGTPKGAQASVMGDFTGPPPSALAGPSAFGYEGTGTQLPTAMMGMMSDMQATLQETRKVLQDVAVTNQRIATMIGDVVASNANIAASISSSIGAGSSYSGPNSSVSGANLRIPGTSAAYGSFSTPGTSSAPIAPGTDSGWHSPPPSAIRKDAGEVVTNTTSDVVAGAVGGDVAGKEVEKHEEQSPPDAVKAAHDAAIRSHQLTRDAVSSPSLKSISALVQGKVKGIEGGSGILGRVVGHAGDAGAVGELASGSKAGEVLSGLTASPIAAGVIGGIVAAPELYNHLGDVVSGYRQQGAQYQSIEGGSEIGGMVESWRSKLFGLSNAFGMGDQQAQQLFQGVTQLGITGGERSNYLEFATTQWSRLGMSVAQSLEVVTAAAQHGQENLNGVAAALTNVTNAASGSGLNASEARQSFIQAYTSNLSSGLGSSSAGVASQGSSILAAVGHLAAGVGGAGTLTDTQLSVEAGMNGLTPAQLQQRIRDGYNGMSGSHYQAQLQQNLIQQVVSPDSMLSPLVNLAKSTKLAPNSTELLNQVQDAANAGGIFSSQQLAPIMQQMGLTSSGDPAHDEMAIAAYVRSAYNGGFTGADTSYATKIWLANNQSKVLSSMSGRSVSNPQQLIHYRPGRNADIPPSPADIRGNETMQAWQFMQQNNTQGIDIRDLIQHAGGDTFRLANGKTGSLQDLMGESGGMAALNSGAAKILTGAGKGKTVGEWVSHLKDGVKTDNVNGSNSKKSSSSKKSGQQVSVTVTAKPPLDALLQFATSNGSSLLSSQMPPDPYPSTAPSGP